MDLYIYCLGDIDARARRGLKEFHLKEAKSTNKKVRLLKELGQIILDEAIKNEQVRSEIFQTIPPSALKIAIEDCQRLMRPSDDNYFNFLANRYGYLRRFAPVFFSVFSFTSNLADDPLLKALSLLRELDGENKRKIPNDAPQDFISPKWKKFTNWYLREDTLKDANNALVNFGVGGRFLLRMVKGFRLRLIIVKRWLYRVILAMERG